MFLNKSNLQKDWADFINQSCTFLLSICTGILGVYDILQFEISSLMICIFFLVWKKSRVY